MVKTMKNRVVRVPDDIWDAAQTQAQATNTTVSTVVRKFLLGYGSKHLEHQTLHIAAPVPHDYLTNSYLTPESIRDEILAGLTRTAATENRTVVESSLKLISDTEHYTYTDESGKQIVDNGLIMLKFSADTIPA